MKPDISTANDIKRLVDTFYAQVQSDMIIGPIFNTVMGVDWDVHLPKMYSFWEFALLGTTIFKGNPMKAHKTINAKVSLTSVHFERWISLWNSTIDNLFEGEVAQKAKDRAELMKITMLIKLNQINQG